MRLTKAEEQIMKILWDLGNANVQDILNSFDGAKPARTTVATVLSVLEKKGFVEHYSQGRTNYYRPVVEKNAYSKKQLFNMVKDYFDGSYTAMFSFFAKESNMTLEEMDKIIKETRSSLEKEDGTPQ